MGSDDPLVPPINGHILARLIPNAELRMIDDGHLFMVTKPAESAALIEEFLADERKRVEPGSRLPSRTVGRMRRLLPTRGWRTPTNLSAAPREDIMTEPTSHIDMLRKFGSDLGLPKVDVDKLLEVQKKNIDALGQSAKVAAQGAQSVAQKQREVLEAGLQEAATLAREYKPLGKVHANLALQTEFARKVFELAVKGAQDSATTARQSTTDAVKIIQDRMKESFEEIRASVSQNKSA
jgi:phasin family protein